MTTHGRRQSLIEMLRKDPGLRVPELAKAFGVSEGTVRNDLNALEKEGRLKRVHGGAILNTQSQFQNNSFIAINKMQPLKSQLQKRQLN